MARFVVVGVGNVGLRVLWDLSRRGHRVVGLDSRLSAVEEARRLGLDAVLGDYGAVGKVIERLGGVDVIVSALPGSIGFRAVVDLAVHGVDIVDVSFFPEDPEPLREVAEKHGITIVVDAGIAPGLSNVLVGYFVERGARRAEIYVGGVAARPGDPLGLAAVWSVDDLIDEYLRPARFVLGGRVHVTEPLRVEPGLVEIEGVGMMEYFPTDGLRSLLKSYPHMDFMIEYTLRWPGHLGFMKKLASIGLLSGQAVSVSGLPVRPREFLARLIERHARGVEDLVVMRVVTDLHDPGGARLVVEPQESWSAMAIATGSVLASIAEMVAEGNTPRGLVYPERFGASEELFNALAAKLLERGLEVEFT